MATIKDIAAECGVSVQSIRAWCRRNQVAKDAKGKWKLDESTLSLIREYYQIEAGESSESKSETACASSESKLSAALQAEVDHLRGQIAVKDKQIADLSSALVAAQDANKALSANAAMHTAADKKEELTLESTEQKTERKTRWQRLKEAWKG